MSGCICRSVIDARAQRDVAKQRVKEQEEQIASEASFYDYRLRYVEIQADREIWIECCKKHCPDAVFVIGLFAGYLLAVAVLVICAAVHNPDDPPCW
jgi:hypothetical protein